MAFKRALVVDDSRSARVAMKIMLEEHGLGVEFAESGEEGLEFLKKNLVDVIFMDHTMPGCCLKKYNRACCSICCWSSAW
jgi:CheY-like chemotaxis protein